MGWRFSTYPPPSIHLLLILSLDVVFSMAVSPSGFLSVDFISSQERETGPTEELEWTRK